MSSYPASVPIDVAQMFEEFTFQAWEKGLNHYSARAILHRIRWHYDVEMDDHGDREFKCNNNWTPVLARWLMKKYPTELTGFFFTRKARVDGPTHYDEDEE